MILKKNVLASYLSQFYLILVNLLMLPQYINYLGAEAYGLVGFFSMLQIWFNLLDLGLTPTIGRETARFCGGAISALSYRQLYRGLCSIFVFVGLFGFIGLCAASGVVASRWLNVNSLPVAEVTYSLKLMAAVVALRWMTGLFRGVVSGFEFLVWLGVFNTLVSTVRFVLVIPALILWGPTIKTFFLFQLGVAVLELAIIAVKSNHLVPSTDGRIGWSLCPVLPVIRFSMVIAFTSSLWVLVTQIDKLLLSRLLSLDEYGYFTLAVLLAGGILTVSSPMSMAIMPRLARFDAEGNTEALLSVYRQSTQIVAVLVFPIALVLSLFSADILFLWTGNLQIVAKASDALRFYSSGNVVLAFAAFPYYLQYAKGQLRLHFVGSIMFVLLLIPSVFYATLQSGAPGAGYAWMFVNIIYFAAWVPIVHRHFYPHLHWDWLRKDILPILIGNAAVGILLSFFSLSRTRGTLALQVAVIALSTLVISAFSSHLVRNKIMVKFSFYNGRLR